VLKAMMALMGLFLFGAALAHDHNHPEMEGWFKSLHSKGGAWCCSGDDAEIADYELVGNHYRVRIGDQWVTVPEDAIIEGENKVGGARVWPYYTNGRPNVRCFLPDALT